MDSRINIAILASALVMLLETSPAEAQTPPVAQGAVQVQSLDQVEPFRVGARSGIAYAMSAQQWRGTSAAIAAKLISDLPQAGASPLLNRLAASVLMAPSDPPAGSQADSALASLRLASVYRLGALEAVIDLAERSPGGLSDPENAAIASRAFLALGQDKQACDTASRLQKGRGAVFWLKLRAFCLARQGNTAAAELSADLATEADPDDTDFLLALNRMLVKDTAPVKPINALELAMARYAGAPVDLSDAPLALHSAMVHAGGLAAIAAARHMAQTGMLQTRILAKLYLAWPGTAKPAKPVPAPAVTAASEAQSVPDDGGAARLERALAQSGDARAALLYQSAALASSNAVRADAIAAGLHHESRFAGFLSAARLYAPLLQKLAPEDVHQSDRQTLFSYALLAGGQAKQARGFVTAGAAAPDSPAMARLLTLYANTPPGAPDHGPDNTEKAVEQDRLAYIDLMALGALGKPLKSSARQFLFSHLADTEEYTPCAAGARAAITTGAARPVRAATILRAALMLADSGFDNASPECGAAVIQALRALAYTGPARQAALEMMLGPRWRALDHAHE